MLRSWCSPHRCPWVTAAPVCPSVCPPCTDSAQPGNVGATAPQTSPSCFAADSTIPKSSSFFYPGPCLPCGTKLSNLCGLWVLEEGGQRGEESGVLRANPQSSVLESHSSPGALLHRCGEPAAPGLSGTASSSRITGSCLAWACWQRGHSVVIPTHGVARGQQHLRHSLHIPGAGDSFADGAAANVPESSVKR